MIHTYLIPSHQGLPSETILPPHLHLDLLDLKSQDDAPNQSKDESGVPVNDVLGPNVLQINLLPLQEADAPPDVLDLVDPQFTISCESQDRESQSKHMQT